MNRSAADGEQRRPEPCGEARGAQLSPELIDAEVRLFQLDVLGPAIPLHEVPVALDRLRGGLGS